jgi:cytidine deaminase
VSSPLDPETAKMLVERARAVRAHAYAPYSRFHVGAALLDEDGQVHVGVNVENASYPVGLCAERTALAGAVTRGVRRFRAIAIVCEPSPKTGLGSPCGMCRQALHELAPALTVYLAPPTDSTPTLELSLAELLPRAFGPESL